MLKSVRNGLAIIALSLIASVAFAQNQCPGFNAAKNTNLACELATGLRATVQDQAGLSSLTSIYVTMGTQLSQLPIAAAASSSGITIGASGLPTVSTEGLGTILTQRGTTVGKHKFLLSFNFQRFVFQSVDGVDLKKMPFVFNSYSDASGNKLFITDTSAISFRVNQYTTIATFGLTNKVDVAFILPFSQVGLDTGTQGTLISITPATTPAVTSTALTPNPLALPGSATGLGDVRVNVKGSLLGSESKNSLAIGGEIRFPTGDAANFLGTGAYGIKPYLIWSRRGRVTPNVNIGYQWNGASILSFNDNLPSSFLYSGGADVRATKRLTLTAELLGQYVIDAPRVKLVSVTIPNGVGTYQNATSYKGGYFSDNAAFGFKVNPFKGLILSSSALFKLDNNGLRQRHVVPLFGVAYRF